MLRYVKMGAGFVIGAGLVWLVLAAVIYVGLVVVK